MYFDDFMPSGNEESSASPSGCHRGSSSSLVSDAASYAAWKLQGSAKPSMAPAASFKKLSFKKRKTGAVLEDDSLEDTASSPVNSPKVWKNDPSRNCTYIYTCIYLFIALYNI